MQIFSVCNPIIPQDTERSVPLIPLSRPSIGVFEEERVLGVLRSNRLALGPVLNEFETRMAMATHTCHAVAVNSGTAALHLILRALGIGPSDEVITTPYSFVASSNAVLYTGASVRFVDIDPNSLNIDPQRVSEAVSARSRAVLGVDVFGLPAEWPTLTSLAEKHGIAVVDDACEGLGASHSGRPIGAWGNASAFGFYPNKQITTGEGGCITTDDHELARLCRSLRNHGRSDDDVMEHVRLGYNYRMSDVTAALGCAQLERLPELLEERSRVATWYNDALSPLRNDLALPVLPSNAERSWFVYVVRLHDHFSTEARDELMLRLRDGGIGSAPYFPSIHLQPFYRKKFGYKPGDFPICEAASARTLALPFFPGLSSEEVLRVATAIRDSMPGLPRCASTVFVNSDASKS